MILSQGLASLHFTTVDSPTAKHYVTHLPHLVVCLLQVVDSVIFWSGLDSNQCSAVLQLRVALQDNLSMDDHQMAHLDYVLQSLIQHEHSLSIRWNNPMECCFPIHLVAASSQPMLLQVNSLHSSLSSVWPLCMSWIHKFSSIYWKHQGMVLQQQTSWPGMPALIAVFNLASGSDVAPYLCWVQSSQSNAFGVVTHLSGLATTITNSIPKDPNTYILVQCKYCHSGWSHYHTTNHS